MHAHRDRVLTTTVLPAQVQQYGSGTAALEGGGVGFSPMNLGGADRVDLARLALYVNIH